MTPVEIGLSTSLIIVVALIVRLNLNATMRNGTKAKSYRELQQEIERMRLTADGLAEQNAELRSRLQMAEADRHNLEIKLAQMTGEQIGRSQR